MNERGRGRERERMRENERTREGENERGRERERTRKGERLGTRERERTKDSTRERKRERERRRGTDDLGGQGTLSLQTFVEPNKGLFHGSCSPGPHSCTPWLPDSPHTHSATLEHNRKIPW